MIESDEENDPTWLPPTDHESETDSETEDEEVFTCPCIWCCNAAESDYVFVDNGEPEDALVTGLLTFVANRKHLEQMHVPLYKELLRNLLNEANTLYK